MLFDLEKEALLASGIKDQDRITHYLSKLHDLYQIFIRQVTPPHDTVIAARRLFNWLWTVKPSRYKRRGSFRLSDVIDNQISNDNRPVGNCLGLTLLYNCLLRKMGVQPGTIYLSDAFGIGPHVLTLLETRYTTIDIEHIFPEGYDYKGHAHKKTRTIWRDRELVAEIYHSQGNAFFEQGQSLEALASYDQAINLNPDHEIIHLNKMILLDKMQNDPGP